MLVVMLVVERGLVGVFRRLRGVAPEARVVQAAVRMLQLRMRRGERRGRDRQARMVMVTLRMKVRGLPFDVVPVSLQEAQLGVVEDVEVGSTQAVTCRPNEEVAVVFAGLPPDREVEGGAAQLEAGGQ